MQLRLEETKLLGERSVSEVLVHHLKVLELLLVIDEAELTLFRDVNLGQDNIQLVSVVN